MRAFKNTFEFPFKFLIPNYIQRYLDQNYLIKRYIKFIKRYIYIILKNQKKLENNKISKAHQNLLWINLSAPSIGDSLMDLSSRILIKDAKIDLYTEIQNAHLYEFDVNFLNVFTDKSLINQNDYDLVIIDSYSTRSIRVKNDIAPKLPFVGMFGYFNGPEVNRVLFSFHRMNQLLGDILSESEISKIAKTSLSTSENDKEVISKMNLPRDYISIAIGGEWAYRTFNNWGLFIEKLLARDNQLNIVLVGSQNGYDLGRKLTNNFDDFNITNCVSKYTFLQTAEIIKDSSILVCCDGGLMHAANAVNTPIIPLFARLNEHMQLTNPICSFALFDEYDVNNIDVENIYEMFLNASKHIRNSNASY